MLKTKCPRLNHLMETLKEVNNGKMALLDGKPMYSVCQMMVVRVPCRLPAHGMENVGAWNIGFMGETIDIFRVATHLLAGDGVILLIGIMSSLLHLVTIRSFAIGIVDLWKVIGS